MERNAGFSVLEILVVLVILAILATLSLISLNSHRRMVKTEDAATSIFTVMRQARLQAITRRQYYGVVINTSSTTQQITLSNSTTKFDFLPQSATLIDMGSLANNDETIALAKKLPVDVFVNVTALTSTLQNAFPVPEKAFPPYDFANGPFICYFDPAGRIVNSADNTGVQIYGSFFFSSFDVDTTKGPTLMRALTLYGATGGLKYWRYIPVSPAKWITQLS